MFSIKASSGHSGVFGEEFKVWRRGLRVEHLMGTSLWYITVCYADILVYHSRLWVSYYGYAIVFYGTSTLSL